MMTSSDLTKLPWSHTLKVELCVSEDIFKHVCNDDEWMCTSLKSQQNAMLTCMSSKLKANEKAIKVSIIQVVYMG